MYKKRNRIYDRLAQDKASGYDKEIDRDFVTLTFRVGSGGLTVEQSFAWAKPAMSYAVQQVRKARTGLRGKNGHGGARYNRRPWRGVQLEYINDVDVQPGTGMAHIHSLVNVRQLGRVAYHNNSKRHAFQKRLAIELQYYVNNYLRRKLGLESLRWERGKGNPYTGRDSLAYVHISGARSSENCAQYMALHNGKIWSDGRRYPRGYRRFATSRNFLLPEQRVPTDYQFAKVPMGGVISELAAQGVSVFPVGSPAQDGACLEAVAVTLPDSYAMRRAMGLLKSSQHSEKPHPHIAAEQVRLARPAPSPELAQFIRQEEGAMAAEGGLAYSLGIETQELQDRCIAVMGSLTVPAVAGASPGTCVPPVPDWSDPHFYVAWNMARGRTVPNIPNSYWEAFWSADIGV